MHLEAFQIWAADARQLHTVFESLVEGLVIFNQDGDVLYMNPSAKRLCGFEQLSDDSLKRLNISENTEELELFYLDGRPVSAEKWPIRRILQGESFSNVELKVRRPNTGELWVASLSGSLVENELVIGVLTMQDISTQKVAEERFSAAFHASPAPTVITDLADMRIVDVNDSFLQLIGYKRSEFVGQIFDSRAMVVDPEIVSRARAALLKGKSVAPTEVRLRDKMGRLHHIIAAAESIKFNGVVCALVTQIDVTERKNAEEKLRRLADFQKALVDIIAELWQKKITPAFYQLLLEQAIAIIPGAEAGSVLVRKDDGRYHYVATVDYDLQSLLDVTFSEQELYFDTKDGLKAPQLIYNLQEINERTLDKKRTRQLRYVGRVPQIKVALAVPIRFSGELKALLSLDNKASKDAFDADALDMAAAFGTQIGAVWQRLQLQAELEHSERLYRSFVEHSAEGIYLLEFERPIPTNAPLTEQVRAFYECGHIAACNDALAQLYGFRQADELVGKSLMAAEGLDDRFKQLETLKAWISDDYRTLGTITEIKTVGGLRFISSNRVGIAKNGFLLRVWVSQQDITARKRAEEALRDSEQRMALHIQHTPLAVIEWDVDRKVLAWNPAAEEIFGYGAEEVIGKQTTDLIIPEPLREPLTSVWESLLAQTGGTRSTNENITKDGRIVICEWYNTPLVDEEGRVKGVASLAQDVTERMRTEKQLMQAIQAVMQDTAWFSRSVMEKLAQIKAESVDKAGVSELTAREKQVLELVARGQNNEQIASELGIAKQTVRNYITRVYEKLGVHSRAEAIVWARERGLVGG